MRITQLSKLKLISLFGGLFLCTLQSTQAAERDLVLDPLQPGPYAVGSTNFEIDSAAVDQVHSQGGNTGDYQEGKNSNGELLYVSDLLANPEQAFFFTVSVPNDATLYGESAGSSVPYAGYVLYPTSSSNTRADYTVFNSPDLPKMQGANEAPIFENESTRYPLIVYSHGVGSHPSEGDFTYIKDLASHGYIVMALYHGDSRWEDTEARHFNLRPLSVKIALDVLLAHEDFANHIDTDKIGGLGESFGGTTMLALLGARKVNPDVASVVANTLLQVQTDPRIKAAAAVVPYMGAGPYTIFGSGGTGAATVDRPFLANSGTEDTVADYDKVQAVFEQLSGDKYLVEYTGEGHDLSDGANVDASTWMKLFMDAKVKEDPDAIETLSRIKSVADTGADNLVIAGESSQSGGTNIPPTQEPTAQSASFANNVLTLPSVVVQGQTYTVSLTLQSSEQPYLFAVTLATPVDAVETASATFNETDGKLTIPSADVLGADYAIEMVLTDQAAAVFTLTSAEQN